MNLIDVIQRITKLKEWQYDFREKIRIDPFWEGYNAAVVQEIRWLEEQRDLFPN